MPNRASRVREKLLTAQKKKIIVQFTRPFETGEFSGFVMDIGPKFFVLASLDDGFAFESYSCLRIKDVRRLQCPAKYAEFYTAARKLRGDKRPRKIVLDLSSIGSILTSAAPSLLTIHREKRDPDTCNIGYLVSHDEKTLEMIEIAPGAKWEAEPSYFSLKEITRIDLPGPYERALIAVGGYPEFFAGKSN